MSYSFPSSSHPPPPNNHVNSSINSSHFYNLQSVHHQQQTFDKKILLAPLSPETTFYSNYGHVINSTNSSNSSSSAKRVINLSVTSPRKSEMTGKMPEVSRHTQLEVGHPFTIDEEVFYKASDGTKMFGSIGEVNIDRKLCKVLFDDGTIKWAKYDRIEKFPPIDEPPAPPQPPPVLPKIHQIQLNSINNNSSTSSSHLSDQIQSNNRKVNSQIISSSRPIKSNNTKIKSPALKNHQTSFICVTCKRESTITNVGLESSKTDWRCIECIKPAKKPKPNLKRKLENSGPEPGEILKNQGGSIKKARYYTSPTPMDISATPNCFKCERRTLHHDRVNCNLCSRPCHLTCLPINPPPMNGDKFWDVICSSCGTQSNMSNDGRSSVYSSRRNINGWSDVALLTLNCLSARDLPNGSITPKFFDIDTDLLPFIDINLPHLHLPKFCKEASQGIRKEKLLEAMKSSDLRFHNGRDAKKKCSLWGIKKGADHTTRGNNSSTSGGSMAKSSSQGRDNKGKEGGIPKMKITISPSSSTPPSASSSSSNTPNRILQISPLIVKSPTLVQQHPTPPPGAPALTMTPSKPPVLRPELPIKSPIVFRSAKEILAKEKASRNDILLENTKLRLVTATVTKPGIRRMHTGGGKGKGVPPSLNAMGLCKGKTTPDKLLQNSSKHVVNKYKTRKRQRPPPELISHTSGETSTPSTTSSDDDDDEEVQEINYGETPKLPQPPSKEKVVKKVKLVGIGGKKSCNKLKELKRGPGKVNKLKLPLPGTSNGVGVRRRGRPSKLLHSKTVKVHPFPSLNNGVSGTARKSVVDLTQDPDDPPLPPFNPCFETMLNTAILGFARIKVLPKEPSGEVELLRVQRKLQGMLLKEGEKARQDWINLGEAKLNFVRGRNDISREDAVNYNTLSGQIRELKNRDLDNLDSYEIRGMRIDEGGEKRYLIHWKTPGAGNVDSDCESEPESSLNRFDIVNICDLNVARVPGVHSEVPPITNAGEGTDSEEEVFDPSVIGFYKRVKKGRGRKRKITGGNQGRLNNGGVRGGGGHALNGGKESVKSQGAAGQLMTIGGIKQEENEEEIQILRTREGETPEREIPILVIDSD